MPNLLLFNSMLWCGLMCYNSKLLYPMLLPPLMYIKSLKKCVVQTQFNMKITRKSFLEKPMLKLIMNMLFVDKPDPTIVI